MNAAPAVSGFIQGLVGGIVALAVLAIRAAMDGRPGVSFADLWTAVATGVAVGVVPPAIARLVDWRLRRAGEPGPGRGLDPSGTTRARVAALPPRHRPTGSSAPPDRFNRFTDRARTVLTLAQDEAQRFNHNYVGTEHLLLGLVREGEGVAARVLENLGVELAKVRTAVEFIIGRGDTPVVGGVGLTPRAKRVIELAIDEARSLDHDYVGTEHLLLGLIGEGQGIGAKVLESLGVNLDRARVEVLRVIGADDRPGDAAPPPT